MIEQRLDGSEKRSLPSKQTNKQTNINKHKKKICDAPSYRRLTRGRILSDSHLQDERHASGRLLVSSKVQS